MNNTRLYIEGLEVELDKSVQFSLNRQFEDLSNPTNIINTWSKTVSIPFTENNNTIFGNIYNTNRIIIESSTNNYGIYFNPTKKINFRLDWNNNVLMQGYAKMNNVTVLQGKGYYNLTLYGELGRVFSEMKKITFDTSTTDTNYLIDGSQYVDENITRELVYSTWTTPQQTITLDNSQFTDIIGFAPNNSFSDDFDYESYQDSTNSFKKFSDVLKELSGWESTVGINPETILKNGLLPRQIGEFRSYYQIPYIYFNKLFQIFQAKAESITGYKFNLDSNWFVSTNPYWGNLIYTLQPFNVKNGEDYLNSYGSMAAYADTTYGDRWGYWQSLFNTQQTRTFHFTTNSETIPIKTESTTFSRFNFTDDVSKMIFNMNIDFELSPGNNSNYMNTNNALLVDLQMVGSNGTIQDRKFLIRRTGSTITEDGYQTVDIEGHTTNITSSSYRACLFTLNPAFSASKSEFGNYVSFKVVSRWYDNSFPFDASSSATAGVWYRCTIGSSGYNGSMSVDVRKGYYRSGGHFTLNDLWNKEYNLFDEIIKYCKIYRIFIDVDDINKIVYFKPYSTYFTDYNILNWADKVDYSKDFIVQPVVFDDKYILFNYEDDKTKLGEKYRDTYGVNYGEKRLISNFNFNNNTKKLFDKIQTSIVNTDTCLSWTTLYDRRTIKYYLPSETFIYSKDKDNKYINKFGSYYFCTGLANFDTTNYMRGVSISDDTDFQQSYENFAYSQQQNSLDVATYPNITTSFNNKLCLFNTPSEKYSYNETIGGTSIYNGIWKKYIEERYDVQNKLVTCYIRLTPIDYINFKWSNFIIIDKQLYIVNKIYDYDITSTYPTKVDLITIQNLSNYQ